ncbi:sulfatase [Chitinophaga sp. MM2321]|uniref:sulfatase family protein n=1 Tax=Chitinophaga sp. MM2321 TaxID=3137178 RepID=UPI0032D59412
MTSRNFFFGWVVLTFLTACGTVPDKATGNLQPNIVLILSDDHSAPYLSCYDHPDLKTPNIDKIAKRGVRFDRAYTTAPQCVLSRASIMTGRNVLDLQMLRFTAPLNKDIITGPEILKQNGYYTGLCGRNYHLDGSGNGPKESDEAFEKYGMVTFAKRLNYVKIEEDDEKTIDQFREFLDEVPKGKPFFIQTCYSDPHRPFTAKEFEPDPTKIKVPAGMPDTKLLREDLAAHYGEIQRLDQRVGLLLEELEKRNLTENTLVVFMGDNGAALLRGKGTLYEGGLHVPLVAQWPGVIKPGSVSNHLVSGEDLVSTFLEVAGIKSTKEIEGQSFLPTFKNEKMPDREYVFAVRGPHGSALPDTSSGGFDLSRTVISKRFKLIYNPMYYLNYQPVDFGKSPFWKELVTLSKQGKLEPRFAQTTMFTPQRPMFELFDLENDPDEFNNLYGKEAYKDIEYQLKKALHQWMIRYRDMVPLPILPGEG